MFEIKNLVVNVEDKQILKGVNLTVNKNTIHIIMGKNGCGKSSLLNSIVKNPVYKIQKGDIFFENKSVKKLAVYEIAQKGIFLSFQNAPAISGLSVSSLLKNAVNSIKQANGEKPITAPEYMKLVKTYSELLEIPTSWLSREVNKGFSGGEKKRLSMLEMLFLSPKLALLDEPDSGVDTESINIIIKAINYLRQKGTAFVIVSHYEKLIRNLNPDFIHIMSDGKIVKTGDISLLNIIEKEGFNI